MIIIIWEKHHKYRHWVTQCLAVWFAIQPFQDKYYSPAGITWGETMYVKATIGLPKVYTLFLRSYSF